MDSSSAYLSPLFLISQSFLITPSVTLQVFATALGKATFDNVLEPPVLFYPLPHTLPLAPGQSSGKTRGVRSHLYGFSQSLHHGNTAIFSIFPPNFFSIVRGKWGERHPHTFTCKALYQENYIYRFSALW